MSFTYLTKESWITNLNDKGEGIPDPVICNSFCDPTMAGQFHNAELKICLAIWFEPHTTGMGKILDADDVLFDVQNWGPADDFPGWCRKAIDIATAAFDDKLILIPPKRYNGLDRQAPDGSIWRPNIRCRFLCQLGSAKYFNCKVKVAIPLPRTDGKTFRANSRKWVKSNINSVTFSSAVGNISQNTAAHETGHLLGLHHIGGVVQVKDCRMKDETPLASGNVCYASNDPEPSYANNIMGLGMQVSQYNSLPWRQEFCKHANFDEIFGKLKPDELTAVTTYEAPKHVK